MSKKPNEIKSIVEIFNIIDTTIENIFDGEMTGGYIQLFLDNMIFGTPFAGGTLEGYNTYNDVNEYYFQSFYKNVPLEYRKDFLEGLIINTENCKLYSEIKIFSYENQLEKIKLNNNSEDSVKVNELERSIYESKKWIKYYELQAQGYKNELLQLSLPMPRKVKKINDRILDRERYFVFKELVLNENVNFDKLPRDTFKEIVAFMFNVNIRTAQGFINDEDKYCKIERSKKDKIIEDYIKIGIELGKR